MAGGTVYTPGSAYGGVGIYNNSPAAQVIAVWDFSFYTSTGDTAFFFLYQGLQGGTAIAGLPRYGGEAPGPGQIVTAVFAAPTGLAGSIGVGFSKVAPWFHDLPYTILQPGWGLWLINEIASPSAIAAYFSWEWMDPSEPDPWSYPFEPE